MKRILILLIFLISLAGSVFGQAVDENTAKNIALSFLARNINGSGLRTSTDLELAYKVGSRSTTGKTTDTYFYVFNTSSKDGFVIVTGNERVAPVLAYSNEGSFNKDDIPQNVAKWLEGYKKEISYVLEKKVEPTDEIREEWKNLKSGKLRSNQSQRTKAVSPLIQTEWNQSPFYNALCPFDFAAGDRAVTGCVATAMAQVMKYWNYPAKGTGFHSYNHPSYGTLSANFGSTSYQWSSMPNQINSTNNAVATLMYHCGVSVEMNYGVAATGGSSTNSLQPVSDALKKYFQYSSSVQFVYKAGNYSDATWIAMLKGELDAGRPIEYAGGGSGGGHAFVCDGYDNNNFFHFNWGWSGQSDGYFLINSLNPGSLGIGGGDGGYNNIQQAVIGIKPPTGTQTFDMRLFDDVTPSSSAISYGQAFTISTNILNNGSNTFAGDYSAAVFDASYNFIEFVEVKENASLQGGFVYQNNLVFSSSGLLSMLPGTYYVSIFYRPTGGNWILISDDGSYSNITQIDVEHHSPIELNSAITVTPSKLVKGKQASVNLNVVNTAPGTFIGAYGVGLFNLDGSLAQTIAIVNESNGLPSGYTYSAPYLTFSTTSVTVDPGTYLLAVQHNPNNTGWLLTGSTNFQNPIKVIVEEPPLQPDQYESNNTLAQAKTLPVTFSKDEVSKNTSGTNLHIGSDYDFFRINLPEGYEYSISARLHDSYNSDNGNTYTADAIFSYSFNGVDWSDVYDDTMPEEATLAEGGTVFFHVAPYFSGETGTYLLDVILTRQIITGIESVNADLSDLIDVYPNPASKSVTVNMEGLNGFVKEVTLINSQGQKIESFQNHANRKMEIPLTHIKGGLYVLQLKTDKGSITKKLIVNQ